jgi:hypothetical protein
MNTSTKQHGGNRLLKPLAGVLTAGLLLGLTGCSTTRQMHSDKQSGFLGDNYSLLKPGAKDEVNYVYIDPTANWAKYTKVYIKPIELWHADDPDSPLGKLSQENQALLISYFHHALVQNLELEYKIVDQPGPDVLVIRAAITEAKKSKPVLNLITGVYLPLRVISFGKRLATGSDIAVGTVQVEAEFMDGQTGKLVAAAMDARVGTKALRSKFGGTWGDIKLSFDWWAQRTAVRLAQLQGGDTSTDKK